MQIVTLEETEFDNFAINHPLCNYYQSSYYGKFMTKHGYNAYYLGLSDDFNNIKAATLIIVKNESSTRIKTAYAPRGFLIDWDDKQLVREFTEKIKDYLEKRNFAYLKVDPKIILKEYNFDGSKKDSYYNDTFSKDMAELGYVELTDSNYKPAKPKWDTLINLDSDINHLYKTFSRQAREKIIKANNVGNKVYKGNIDDMSLFYELLDNNRPPLDYYNDLYEIFGKEAFEIYFVKLQPVDFVNSSKQAFEEEEKRNNELNYRIQNLYDESKDSILNEKLRSDEVLAKNKKDMEEAISLFNKYPNGIIVGTCATIKFGSSVTFLTSGINSAFTDLYPEYLLKWQLAEEFAINGYKIIDSNGINGKFIEEYINYTKRELSNQIVEYVGEFDLVINKKAYYTGSKLIPILNWLNTPI